MKILKNIPSDYAQVELRADTTETIAPIKPCVDKIMGGHILGDGKSRVCHSFSFREDSSSLLTKINDIDGVHLVPDKYKMVLRLYGEPDRIVIAEKIAGLKAASL
ncbi:hypothetical protein K458DRAFT_316802, partial [Lentithecium fluviatile CBS 122367]